MPPRQALIYVAEDDAPGTTKKQLHPATLQRKLVRGGTSGLARIPDDGLLFRNQIREE